MDTAMVEVSGTSEDAECAVNCVIEKPSKKARVDGGADVRRVAEIVMVLAASSMVRAGRAPSAAETELMGEAREKLAEICGLLAPKDIVGKDAVRVVSEDLGLTKLKDQRSGNRAAKATIAEKLALTRRKMEESSREATITNPPSPPQIFPVGVVSSIDSQGANFYSGVTNSNIQPQAAVFIMGQPPGTSSSGDPHSFAQSVKEPKHFMLDPRVNATPYIVQVPGNRTVVNIEPKSEISSSQVSASAVSKMDVIFKSPYLPSLPKQANEPSCLPMSSQPIVDHNTNAPGIQTTSVYSLNSSHSAQSMYLTHIEIAKKVQRFLVLNVPDRPKEIPPSSSYVSKPLPCAVCKLVISDIKSLRVCDACEKGTHITCLPEGDQTSNFKGDWHCRKCLILSSGKTLSARYGRVNRGPGTAKASMASDNKKMNHSSQNDNDSQKAVTSSKSDTLNAVAATGRVQSSDEPISDFPNSNKDRIICPKVLATEDVNNISQLPVKDLIEESNISTFAFDDSQVKPLSDDNQSCCDSKFEVSLTMLDAKGEACDPSFSSPETGNNHDVDSQASGESDEVPELKMKTDATVDQKQSVGGVLDDDGSRGSKDLIDTGKCIGSEPQHDGDHVLGRENLDHSDGKNDFSRYSLMLDVKCQAGDLSFTSTETGINHDVESQAYCESEEVPEMKLKTETTAAQKQPLGELLEDEGPRGSKELADGGKCIGSEPQHDGDPSFSRENLDNSDEKNDLSRYSPMVDVKYQAGDPSFTSSDTGINHDVESQAFCESDEVPEMKFKTDTTAAQKQSLGEVLEDEEPRGSKEVIDPGKFIGSEPQHDIEDVSHHGDHVLGRENSDNTDEINDFSNNSAEVQPEVEWIGQALEVVDDKTYYEACYISGISYKAKEYALLRSNVSELQPSRVQVMWEDNKTRTKWAKLSRCYFPNDLPEYVQRPSTPENDEVYESNNESNALLGLLRGPCKVLSYNEYCGELEARQHDSNCELPPVYMCKWLYDKSENKFSLIVDET